MLTRSEENVNRAAIECAKLILLQLSLRSNESVDLFSINSAKNAQEYRAALTLFLRNPSLNPALTSATGYAGGISVTDWNSNLATVDNITVCTPMSDTSTYTALDI
jgi:hypothetical protein